MSKIAPVRYHPLQVSFHWLVVVLVFIAFILGKYISSLPNNEAGKIAPLGIHMLLGGITLMVIIARFITRLRLPKPDSATTGNAFLDQIGKLVHYALYVFVFLMTISGMALSFQSGLMPIVFGNSGAALPVDFLAFTSRMLHGFIASALVLLILLHAGAALYHQFMLKDNLLARMWYGK
ncbi:MAG: cytochrome b [Anaerolineales bacterium]|uniref:cytochrome b n=1 Tax=Candidatus Villigracilis proximus TaxID=3140683 RepID=UPI003135B955|nr:cytochrome b [Anaerolineales bacterium]